MCRVVVEFYSQCFLDSSENEILSIVRKSKTKTSVDNDGIDMTIIKNLLTVFLNHLLIFVIC